LSYIPLGYHELVIPAGLLLILGILSLRLSLGLERQLLVAGIRMVVQLALVGYLLTFLFSAVSLVLTGIVAALMVIVAGREIHARQKFALSGLWSFGIGTVCILVGATLVTALALAGPLQPEPWYHPRYSLPIFGMVLGNAMTGISLGLDVFTTRLKRDRASVEAQLALGATRWHAVLPLTRDALRSGLMPTINAMAAIGIVSLPGMMTGQIIAGVDPAQAVKYQLLIMFLIAGGTGIATAGAVTVAVFRISDSRHRLRLDRLRAR